jgi:hypothetical protein
MSLCRSLLLALLMCSITWLTFAENGATLSLSSSEILYLVSPISDTENHPTLDFACDTGYIRTNYTML